MRNFPLCPLHQSHRFTILCVGPLSPVFREKCRCFRKCLRAVWDELHAPLTFLFLCFPMRFAFSRIVTVTVEIHSIHSYSSTQNLQNHTSHPTTQSTKTKPKYRKIALTHIPQADFSTLPSWNPNDPCFDWKRPCFGAFNHQNRGQTGSRFIYQGLSKTFPFFWSFFHVTFFLRLKMKAIHKLKNLDRWFVTNLWVSERVTFSLTIHQQNCQAYTYTQTYSLTRGETSYFRNKSLGFVNSLWQKAITFT